MCSSCLCTLSASTSTHPPIPTFGRFLLEIFLKFLKCRNVLMEALATYYTQTRIAHSTTLLLTCIAHDHPYISSSELIIIPIMIFNFYNSTAAVILRLIAVIVLAVTVAGMLTIYTTCTCEYYVASIYVTARFTT